MSRKEALRAGRIKAACGGEISNAEGAAALRLSVRQVQRLKRRYEADDVRGLLHRGRGRPSPPGRDGRGYAGTRVELRECLDGRLVVSAHGQRLMTQPRPARAPWTRRSTRV